MVIYDLSLTQGVSWNIITLYLCYDFACLY